MSDITLEQARNAVSIAIEKSEEIGVKMNIAVVDAGANLKAFARMDDAWLGSIDIAIRKARTARYFNMNTGDIGALSQPGGSLFNIEHSNGGLISFPGGVPIKNARVRAWSPIGPQREEEDSFGVQRRAADDVPQCGPEEERPESPFLSKADGVLRH